MRSPSDVVTPETPVSAAATLLLATGCSGVPVVGRTGEIVGLVTEAELVHHQLSDPAGRGMGSATVRDVMSTEPLLAPSRYDLGLLVGLMFAAGTAVVPIVDAGRLVGVVDQRDLVRTVCGSTGRVPVSRQASC